MKLISIHPDALAGKHVRVPDLEIERLEYGAAYNVPYKLVNELLATGFWEKPKKKKEDKE